jgi:hypothetical protein
VNKFEETLSILCRRHGLYTPLPIHPAVKATALALLAFLSSVYQVLTTIYRCKLTGD